MDRLMQFRKLEHFDAEKLVDDTDHNGSEYLRVFYKRGWREPELYDLMVDTCRAGLSAIVDLLAWWIERPAALKTLA